MEDVTAARRICKLPRTLSQKRGKRAAADRNKLAELLYLTSRIKALNAVSRRICKQYKRIAPEDNFCRLKIVDGVPIVQPVVVNHCQTFDRRGPFVMEVLRQMSRSCVNH